eukprot:CAMPEP_0194159326 /NCGR_PEP_ID=MMETSP0152-20130528/77766_1 /TAXON_ID=1049557 /ORGANISM="Thalassiothrix antarctica, Strain L6-D1" /LENGTH=681 /DNA_ID=CAMNT_0038868879 /DNA_START=51 /DNA_END=2094 /DNA_ORIENTATION=-
MVKLDISLHAKDLKNVAGAFKGTSDPYAVITHMATTPGTAPRVLGKTEIMKNTLSPKWATVIDAGEYVLGEPMKIAVQLFDEVRKGDNKSMGSATFELGEVLAARGSSKARKIKNSGGTVYCHVAKSHGSGELSLKLSASKLKNTEGFMRKSDPFYELCYQRDGAGSLTWDNIYRSDFIKNNLSPTWNEMKISLSVICGCDMDKKVLICVYDHESDGDHVLMGQVETSVNELLGGGSLALTKKGKSTGTLNVKKAEVTGVEEQVQDEEVAGAVVQERPAAPAFVPSAAPSAAPPAAGGGAFVPSTQPAYVASGRPTFADYISDNIYRSDFIKNNLSPTWNEMKISLSVICGCDMDKKVLICVYDHESDGDHVLMGQIETSVNELLAEDWLALTKKGRPTGILNVNKAEITGVEEEPEEEEEENQDEEEEEEVEVKETPSFVPPSAEAGGGAFVPSPTQPAYVVPRRPTFADYISGGCELNVSIAIDFTGSNGDPRRQGTLHHRSSYGELNDYEKAIASIVQVLSTYDKDQMYPVMGFGAKYGGVVRHCFQCGPAAEYYGVKGILDAYKETFSSGLIMSKPTIITEVIQMAAARAAQSQQVAQSQGKQSYTILLILTDGSVSDPAATAEVLREASAAPLSVVIVGIGNADFSAMQFLDDCAQGEGDIAQFVPFNSYRNHGVE